jgi:RNA polymerase sigma factor (sigma-70 family)
VQELYDFAARLTHDRAAAADIVQSVFATVWERARRGEEVRSPRAWLYTATRNAAIDEIRRRRHTTFAHHEEAFDFAAVDGARSPEPVHALIDKDLAELVWSTAAALTPDEYALLDLHVRHDLAPAELADELGITTGAVHTRLSRLRRSFEEALTVKLLTRRDDCEQLADLVSTLGERADSPDGQRLLRAHIRDCSTCKESRRRYVTATEVLASLAPVPLMPGVPDAIWSSLVALLGLERGAAAGGTAAAPRGRVSIAARARAKPFAAGALVLAALGLLGLGLWAGSRTLLPDRSAGAVHDPSGFWSPSHQIGRRSTTNRVTVAWARQPDAVAYSVLWSHAPREEPDTVTDLPGTATRTTSPAVAPGRWYFHLRTEGRKDDWTDTVHLGPFVIASPRDQVPTRPAADAKKDGAAGKASGAGATVAGTTTTDSMPPQGQNVALAGGRYYRTLAVSLVLSPGTDAESGIDAASGIVERQAGLLVGGRCAGWGSWQRVVLDRSTDTDVAGGRCYRYRYRISDRAGNRSPFSRPSAVAAVDTTPPERPTLSLTEDGPATITVGTRLIYRPTGGGGTFVVAATTSDAGSGLAALKFPALADGMAATTTTRRTEAPYEMAYTWRGGAVEGGTKTVTAFDRAGNTARATFTITADQTGPKGLSVAVSGGPWFTVASVPLVVEPGVDSGSGVDRRSLAVERDVAPLSAGECGAFAGAWKTVALRGDADTTVESGSCYRYRVVVLDNVGNRSTSSPSEVARIDTTPPTPPKLAMKAPSGAVALSETIVYYGAAAGSFSVEAKANDPESGIAYVWFPPVAGATGGGADATSPYESGYGWIDPLATTGLQRVIASNGAGLTDAGAFTLAADFDAPTGMSIILLAGPIYKGDAVPFRIVEGTDAGSGVRKGSATVERDSALLGADGVCGPYAGSWTILPVPGVGGGADTTVERGRCYRYRVTVSDNVGNTATSAPTGDAIVP